MVSVWRSWFWNLFIMVGMFGMAVSAFGVVASQAQAPGDAPGRLPVMVIAGVFGGIFVVGMIRAPFLGVSARPSGIVVRALTRTITIPWAEVEDIKVSSLKSGPAGMAGATSPVIVWNKSQSDTQLVELSVLGGYSMFRSGPTRQERAAAGLRDHLTRWRRERSVG